MLLHTRLPVRYSTLIGSVELALVIRVLEPWQIETFGCAQSLVLRSRETAFHKRLGPVANVSPLVTIVDVVQMLREVRCISDAGPQLCIVGKDELVGQNSSGDTADRPYVNGLTVAGAVLEVFPELGIHLTVVR